MWSLIRVDPPARKRADGARLIGGPELFRHVSGGSGDAADGRDVGQLADPVRHLLQVRQGLWIAQVARRLDEEVLRNRLVHREMVIQRGVPERARGRSAQGFAVVVVVAHQPGAAGQGGQHQQAGDQVQTRPAHDADTRAPPEPRGQLTSRLDPPASTGERDDGGQQGHRGQECHADTDRRSDTDRLEDTHSGEADHQEGDADGAGRCGDHLADREQRLLERRLVVLAQAQIVVIAADQEDGIIRSGAGHDRAQKDDGLVGDAGAGQRGVGGHHRLGNHQ